jgi:hypothetical protein
MSFRKINYALGTLFLMAVLVTAVSHFASAFEILNQCPVANPGPDQSVTEGSLVELDGGQSSDPDGDALTYSWSQISGDAVVLISPDAAKATFIAPDVSPGGATLTFQLTVSDGKCPVSASMNVIVTNINHPPEAVAGEVPSVVGGSPVELDGSSSFDPDGDTITYFWEQTDGPDVTLSDPTLAKPGFTSPYLHTESAILTFKLTVFDGVEYSDCSDQKCYATVLVEPINHPPVANAGPNQTVNQAKPVILDGHLSSDPDGDGLIFYWTQTAGPTVSIDAADPVHPVFTAPQVDIGGAVLSFVLVVSDGSLFSSPGTVDIAVVHPNSPPSCQNASVVPFLWPPNHKLVPITITGVSDPDNDSLKVTILGVTQDEPVNGLGDGDTSPDAVIKGDKVWVRAERSGLDNGRVYRIRFMAEDSQGANCTGTVATSVPHDMGQGKIAIDDGQVYDSTVSVDTHNGK